MKKVISGLLKGLGVVFIIILIGFAFLVISGGPSDPIILTEEEETKQNVEQISLYANKNLTGFNTTAITGEKISSDYFKDYKITMINLWYTGCSPCIAEMPDIAKLYNTRPEGSNIISICVDTSTEKKAIDKSTVKFANKVMKDAGANFLTLIPDKVLKEVLTDNTTVFPTTIFVDSNGKVVGEPHFGARSAEAYKSAILKRMSLLEQD
ncbi:hypothetical protein SH2C18_39130 [Clostridium sediminicola]|uniref:TlpA family protein disulfide reductase n=1 Tax=Clostridium sediminicola TaxID=3114879 RepID=UPI0031F1E88D